MKVMLLNAAYNRYGGLKGHGGSAMPLNLCYLASYARRAHPELDIRIVDAEAEHLSHEQCVEMISSYKPDLIGITTNTCVFDSVIGLTGKIKERVPDISIVLGGPHPSALPLRTMEEANVDFVVQSEGEVVFSDLIGELKNNRREWWSVRGLVYSDASGNAVVNERCPLIEDLDGIPFPARDLVDIRRYYAPPSKNVAAGAMAQIVTSRGCPHNCGFCCAKTIWGRRIRFRSPANVIEEIKECVGRYNAQSIMFADEFFTANQRRVSEICERILRNNIRVSWVCLARAERLEYGTLKLMARAGCREISFGIESGNEKILKKMDKRLNIEDAKRVVQLARKANIITHASYIIGYLGETESTANDTTRLAKYLNTDIAAYFIASPYPGTRLYDDATSNGWIRPDATWADYSPLSNSESVLLIPGMTTHQIRKIHRKALRGYYLRPKYILMKLLSIRKLYQVRDLFRGMALLFRIK